MTKKKNTPPVVVAVVSDLHSGSTYGLCRPVLNLDGGGTYRAGKHQAWLWHCWNDYNKQVRKQVKKTGGKLVAIVNGDAVEGNHHHTMSVIGSGNETLQMRIAEDNLGVLLEGADAAYFTRGTPAHVGEQSRLEEKIADNWTNVIRYSDGEATWWHLRLDVNGTLFDVAHHGSVGRLHWTKANSLGKIATTAIMQAHETGQRPANVVIRSHLHQYVDTGDNYRTIRVIGMPAWQLITGFVHRISPGSLADIGGLIFTCYPGGDYECDVVRYQPKPDPVQRIDP